METQRAPLPSGDVTLLFTDIEDSTPLFHALGDGMLEVIEQHNELIRAAIAAHDGHEVKTEGDALFVGFASASEAVAACLDAQRALLGHAWPGGRQVRVRMGLHVGPVHVVGHDYIGITVAEAARVSSAAHGSQVLVSGAVAEAVAGRLPDGATLQDLGAHVLKGFPLPTRLFELRHPDLPAGFPPPRTLTATEHNLPASPTPILGRGEELDAVRALLLGDARLVTLTGPGGIGKTRLAIEAARTMLAYVRGGAWLVELAAVTDPGDIMPAIARALDVADRPGVSLGDAVATRLADEPSLLVLDNFEQVIEGATVVSDLLASAARLKVLTTSRERLRLRGEHEIAIEPLVCPSTSDEVEATPGGRLFVERARAADARFSLDVAAAAAVTAVCARCHGMPLAIELAAARVREIPIGELAAELGRGIDLLSEGDRDLPPRHQALRAAIAWSYDGLDGELQRVFRALAVFAGGAPLDAVEVVCGPGARDALPLLRDRSLVRIGEDRVSMLEPLRHHALERLAEAGERRDAERAHGAWLLELAQRADAGIIGPDQNRWVETLQRELDNARAALVSVSVEPDVRLAAAAALGRFWDIRGLWTEGRAWLDGALATEGAAPGIRGRALLGAGALALRQLDPAPARRHLEAALGLARETGDALLEGHALNQLASLARVEGDLPRALETGRAALDAMRRSGDARGILLASGNVALLESESGDLAGARASYREALERARSMGDVRTVGQFAQNLGLLAQREGDSSEARSLLAEAISSYRALGDERGVAAALTTLGAVASAEGDLRGARGSWEEALHQARVLGDRALLATLLLNLVALRVKEGTAFDAAAAADLLARAGEAADLLIDLGQHPRACNGLALAAYHAISGAPDDARRAFARAASVATSLGDAGLLADILDQTGEALLGQGSAEEARSVLERALEAARASSDAGRIAAVEATLERATRRP